MDESRRNQTLSEREEDVLNLSIEGKSDKEIAHELGLSLETVRTYWQRIRHKIGSGTRAEIVARRVQDNADVALRATQSENRRLMDEIELRLATERRLAESEERFRRIASDAPIGIFLDDAAGNTVFVNRAWEAITGMPSLQAMGTGWTRAIHPEDRADVWRAWVKVQTEGSSMRGRLRIVRPTGETRTTICHVAAVRNEGEVVGYVGTLQDVTEEERAQQERDRLAATIEETPDFVGIADAKGRPLYANRAARQLLGIGPDEVLFRRRVIDLYPERLQAFFHDVIAPAVERDGQWRGDTVVVDGGGNEVPASQVLIGHRDANGTLTATSLILRDLREETALRARMDAVARLKNTFLNCADEVFIALDADGRVTQWNLRAEVVFGYPAEAMTGTHLPDGMFEDPDFAASAGRGDLSTYQSSADEPATRELRIRNAMGETRTLAVRILPLVADREALGSLLIGQDVTDLRRREREAHNQARFIARAASAMRDMLYIYDLEEGRNLYANRALVEVLGYTEEQIQAMGENILAELLHPDDVPHVVQSLAEIADLPDGAVQESQYRFRAANGEYRWLRSRDTPFERGPDGGVRSKVGIAYDITDEMEKTDPSENVAALRSALEVAHAEIARLRAAANGDAVEGTLQP